MVFKDIKIESNGRIPGFDLQPHHCDDRFRKARALNPNNPAAAAAMKSMFGGETMNSWLGTDGKPCSRSRSRHGTSQGPDRYVPERKCRNRHVAGFKSVRSRLARASRLVMLVSAQGLVADVRSDCGNAQQAGSESPG